MTTLHTSFPRQAGRRDRNNRATLARLLARIDPNTNTVPTLTVRQPWAYLLTTGRLHARQGQPRKTAENRTWHTRYRGPIAIHAANNPAATRAHYRDAPDWLADLLPPLDTLTPTLGRVVALADLHDITHIDEPQPIEHHANPFLTGPYLWHLRDVATLPRPVKATGKQGLWRWNITGARKA